MISTLYILVVVVLSGLTFQGRETELRAVLEQMGLGGPQGRGADGGDAQTMNALSLGRAALSATRLRPRV
ncbi:MAG TPA: hypothetical protein VFN21_10050 [Acidimicrobiales bacterium]|nr:hypothetical protein [Acidimicrobiales bacterium]